VAQIVPSNRHLLVKLVDAKEDKSTVLVPEGWKPVKEHEMVEVVGVAPDCQMFIDEENLFNNPSDVGSTLMVPGNMLISFTYQNVEHYLVQENYVLAKIVNDS
tara:strand:+ start:905 stop:1213 length:309 start_codon:yes stop_codon:yes gene_type:complete